MDLGKVFFEDRKVYEFNLQAEDGHRRPAFIKLQQYYVERALVERARALQQQGAPLDLRGGNKVTALTPTAPITSRCWWTPQTAPTRLRLIACDGAASPMRQALDLDFDDRVFEDKFLIADVMMDTDFPVERWFWFDPPFNKGQSALLHKQPDNVWRIDLQLGWDIDRKAEKKPENVILRLKVMLGGEINFQLE